MERQTTRVLMAATRAAAIAGVLGLGAPVAHAAQTLQQSTVSPDAAARGKIRDEISLATAKSVADHCIAEAGGRKLDAVVYILNPGGYPVYVARADGLPPITVLVAEAKAKTALVMRDSTHKWMNRAIEDPMFSDKMESLGQHWNSGGLPIVVEGVLIGSIGVGGLPALPDFDDEICGYHALEAVFGPQPPLAPKLPPVTR